MLKVSNSMEMDKLNDDTFPRDLPTALLPPIPDFF